MRPFIDGRKELIALTDGYREPAEWTKVTGGPGSRAAGLAMAVKLIETAQDRWRAVNAPHLVALVRAGAVVGGGVLIERPEPAAA
jgi:hypothetical protein